MARLRDLTPGDWATLNRFECRTFGEPWSGEAQRQIREQLPHEIAAATVQAIGFWVDDDVLVGVAVWRRRDEDLDVAVIPVLAVALGHHRRGYGRLLKTEVLTRARDAGCVVAISAVHEGNEAMLILNHSLGAVTRRDDAYPSYFNCSIDL